MELNSNEFTGVADHLPGIQNDLFLGRFTKNIKFDNNKFSTGDDAIRFLEFHTNILISNNNFSAIKNYAISTDNNSTGDNKMVIKDNYFDNTVWKGIRLIRENNFRIKFNNFDGLAGNHINTGIECYQDNYIPNNSRNPNLIANNTFTYVEKGVIIAPKENVFNPSYSLTGNYTGNIQDVAVVCNDFNYNNYALTGTDALFSQPHKDPNNIFNNSVDWDILWFDYGSTPPFTYYSNSTLQTINSSSLTKTTTYFNGFGDPYNTSDPTVMFTLLKDPSYARYNCAYSYNNDEYNDFDTYLPPPPSGGFGVSPKGIQKATSDADGVNGSYAASALSAFVSQDNQEILVNYKLPENSSTVTLKVWDMSGRVLYSNNQDNTSLNNSLSIGYSNWASGVYLISLESNGIVIEKKKVSIIK